jgi:hypothetical protein
MRILKAGFLYFGLVFGAGFVLGTIRTLFIVPRFGARTAELMETPVMLVVMIFSARWIVRGLVVPSKHFSRIGMGCLALALLLISEFSLVLWLRRISISEYFATRDPIAGTVYYIMLLVFALAPLFVAHDLRDEHYNSNPFKSTPAA